MLSKLLPASDESPACAAFARDLAVRPAGTGLRLDRIVVVPVPEPWPKPATGMELLKPAVQTLARASVPTRVVAAAPWTGPEATAAVEVYERRGDRVVRLRAGAAEPTDLVEIALGLADAPLGPQAAAAIGAIEEPLEGPVFAVCVQGSHDRCCGTDGQALADWVAARPDWQLRRVSHIGGHRFAPTLIEFRSARMWAYVDPDLVERIADRAETSADLEARCRGWLGAATGGAQVAEIAARARHGARLHPAPTITETSPGTFVVHSGGVGYPVSVRAGREIPTIACESPGGLPAKTGIEYEWSIDDEIEFDEETVKVKGLRDE